MGRAAKVIGPDKQGIDKSDIINLKMERWE